MKSVPDLSPSKITARAARDERLAQALRDNLRRRKEQARAQADRGGSNADAAALSDGPLSDKSNRHGGTTAD
jgi:hypothetical protein